MAFQIAQYLDINPPESLSGHRAWCGCCKLIQNDCVLLTGGGDFKVNIWDLQKDKKISSLKGHTGWVTLIDAIK